jgi:iron complex outermembrane receptor protein
LTLYAAAFDIDKPYFALDEHDAFGIIGQQRHRGVEVSLSGQLTPDLHVVAGAIFMTPEVEAISTPQQTIGTRPIGQADRTEQLALDYRTPWLPHLSLDSVLNVVGNRVASVDDRTRVSAYTTLDVGARYRVSIDQHPATLRMQITNITNSLNWFVNSDGGLQALAPRRAWVYLVVDL